MPIGGRVLEGSSKCENKGIPENPDYSEALKMEKALSDSNGKVRVVGLFGNLIFELIRKTKQNE